MRSGKWLFACGLLMLAAPAIRAQATHESISVSTDDGPPAVPVTVVPRFEVISVKPNKSGSGSMNWDSNDGSIRITNGSLILLLRQAYGLFYSNDDQITGLPSWAKNERFDIQAKVSDDDLPVARRLTREQRGQMIQDLLKDRFKLVAHRETREMPIYALVVAKGGAKLKQSVAGDTYPDGLKGRDGKGQAGTMRSTRGTIQGQGVTLDTLANVLTGDMDKTVLDRTGLKGNFDFTLQWTPDDPATGRPGAAAPVADASSGPTLFTAIQEQLGLKLESARGPVAGVVIEHIEQPAEN